MNQPEVPDLAEELRLTKKYTQTTPTVVTAPKNIYRNIRSLGRLGDTSLRYRLSRLQKAQKHDFEGTELTKAPNCEAEMKEDVETATAN